MFGLTYIRNLYNLSMDDLAKKLGVSKQTISKWENKKIPISKDRLEQLSKLFGQHEVFFQMELQEKDELQIQFNKLLHQSKKLNDEEAEKREDELLDILSRQQAIKLNEDISKILMEMNKKRDFIVYKLYLHFNNLILNKKIDNEILGSIFKSFYEIYEIDDSKEPIMYYREDIVDKFSKLLREFKEDK